MAKKSFCSFEVHPDAVAGWIGTYGGENSPADISRLFAGEVATPRLPQLFDRFGIKTSWYIPGQTIETFTEQRKFVAEAGHEVVLHGYTYENALTGTMRRLSCWVLGGLNPSPPSKSALPRGRPSLPRGFFLPIAFFNSFPCFTLSSVHARWSPVTARKGGSRSRAKGWLRDSAAGS